MALGLTFSYVCASEHFAVSAIKDELMEEEGSLAIG